jgi:hypothetical protein
MIHKASIDNQSRVIAESLPAEGDILEVEDFGTATVEKISYNKFDRFVSMTWEDGRDRTYRFSVETSRAA